MQPTSDEVKQAAVHRALTTVLSPTKSITLVEVDASLFLGTTLEIKMPDGHVESWVKASETPIVESDPASSPPGNAAAFAGLSVGGVSQFWRGAKNKFQSMQSVVALDGALRGVTIMLRTGAFEILPLSKGTGKLFTLRELAPSPMSLDLSPNDYPKSYVSPPLADQGAKR